MKNKLIEPLKNEFRIMLHLLFAGLIILLLQSCSCGYYCAMWSALSSKTKPAGTTIGSQQCQFACDGTYQQAPSQTESQPNQAKQAGVPLPGEYYATTVFAGPSLSFLKASGENGDYLKPQPGVGFEVGVGNAFPLNRHWGLTSNLRFKQCNASEKIEYTGGGSEGYEDKYSYNYLAGAILAQYYVSRHFSIVAGPELNYLLSATMKPGGGGEKEKIKDNSTAVGFDIQAGLKFEIPAGNRRSKWALHLLYDHRVSRLNKKQENGYDVDAYHMKTVQLGLRYHIQQCCKVKK